MVFPVSPTYLQFTSFLDNTVLVNVFPLKNHPLINRLDDPMPKREKFFGCVTQEAKYSHVGISRNVT